MVPSAPLDGQLPEMAGTAPRLGMDAASRRTRIKICGCTTAGEVALAVAAGADAVGVIFAPSPRQISIEQAARALAEVPKQLSLVGVFVDPSTAELERAITAMPRLIPQFSGSESPALCRHLGRPFLKVFRVPAGATELALGLAARIADYPDALPIFETGRRLGPHLRLVPGRARERSAESRDQRWPESRQRRSVRQPVASLRRRRTLGCRVTRS